jgi:DNA-binding MarR family transcriptional regulator
MNKVYREKLARFGLTQPQFFLLTALYEEDDILISALAEKVAMDKSALTGLLDRLERDGLVQREASSQDRRITKVKLTPKSEGLRRNLTNLYEEINASFLSRLSEEEKRVFEKVLHKLEKDDFADS